MELYKRVFIHMVRGSGLEVLLLLALKCTLSVAALFSQLPHFWLAHNYLLSGMYYWHNDLNMSTPKLMLKLYPHYEILKERLRRNLGGMVRALLFAD